MKCYAFQVEVSLTEEEMVETLEAAGWQCFKDSAAFIEAAGDAGLISKDDWLYDQSCNNVGVEHPF